MMRVGNYSLGPGLRRVFFLVLLCWTSAVWAGSFEDFFKAIRRDDASKLIELALRGFDMNTRDEAGEIPLVMALKLDALKAAEFLASESSVDVNAQNPAGENALMIAALRGHRQIVDILIERKAQVNKPGWTPLHYAATNAGPEGPGLVALMLEHHAYIDAASPNGSTPLMMAARYGDQRSVQVLLEAGADATLRNQQGLSAMDFADSADRPKVVEAIANAIRATAPKGSW